jgi:predicted dehydrogenase
MTLRVGVVGTSWWTDAMYLPALASHPTAKVVAISGRRREPADELAARWDIEHVFDNHVDMFASGKVDAVIVATPNDTHASIGAAALEAGLAVLCDKPLALHVSDANDLARLAAERGVTTMVPFTYRYMPTSQLVSRLLRDGAIGEPRHMSARYYASYAHGGEYGWRWDRALAGSGVIGDLGSHWLDLARWLLGEVVAVSAHATVFVPKSERPDGAAYEQTEDHAIILTRHASGAIATLEVSAVAAEGSSFGQKHLLEIHGSSGSLEAVNDWRHVQEVRLHSRGSSDPHHVVPWPEDLVDGLRLDDVVDTYHDVFRTTEAMTRAWATAASNKQLCDPDFAVGARVQQLVDAAIASAAADGAWQPVPTADSAS